MKSKKQQGKRKRSKMDRYEKVKDIYIRLVSDKNLTTSKKEELYFDYLTQIRKLAYSGNGNAQFDLSGHYEDINFFGVNPYYNPTKAFYWAKKACENKNANACNNLATFYEDGIGCERDIVKADFFYTKAVELGDDLAKKNLRLLRKSQAKNNNP